MEVGDGQVGEVTCSGSPHLSCKRDQVKMRDYVDRRVPSFPSPSPVIHFFLLLSCPSFLDEPREETLATQASYPPKRVTSPTTSK